VFATLHPAAEPTQVLLVVVPGHGAVAVLRFMWLTRLQGVICAFRCPRCCYCVLQRSPNKLSPTRGCDGVWKNAAAAYCGPSSHRSCISSQAGNNRDDGEAGYVVQLCDPPSTPCWIGRQAHYVFDTPVAQLPATSQPCRRLGSR
jgi:hypothetical protein